jgi:hypothetical protein
MSKANGLPSEQSERSSLFRLVLYRPSSKRSGLPSSILSYIVPSRYETPGKGIWLFNSDERKSVLTEYAKIAWFHAYSPFVY